MEAGAAGGDAPRLAQISQVELVMAGCRDLSAGRPQAKADPQRPGVGECAGKADK